MVLQSNGEKVTYTKSSQTLNCLQLRFSQPEEMKEGKSGEVKRSDSLLGISRIDGEKIGLLALSGEPG